MSRSTVLGCTIVALLLGAAAWCGWELHERGTRVAYLEAAVQVAAAHQVAVDSAAAAHATADSVASQALSRIRVERDSAAARLGRERAVWARERARATADAEAGRPVDLPALIGAGDGLEFAAVAVVDVTDLAGVVLPRLTLPSPPPARLAPEARRSYWQGLRDGALVGGVAVVVAVAGLAVLW